MPLLFQNARIVTATEDYAADLLVIGEHIAAIAPRLVAAECPPGTRVIDATGKLLFPGFIDPHVHVYLPFMGTFAKDDWTSASKAALVGGTTTLIEMICPGKGEEPAAAYAIWKGHAAGKAACDYAFHMGVTRWDALADRQLREIVADGTASFKVFLAYKGALGVDDRELYHALKLARELGVVVTAHCENETLVAERQAELIAQGHTGPEWHEPSRPPTVEASGVEHLMRFAEVTGAEVYVVHTSCADALDAARAGRARGVNVHVESVIPHFVLDRSYAERSGFEGAKYIMSPPLREKPHSNALWQALREGFISTVGTDHAPFDFEAQKAMGRNDFTKIPNGIPSVEHRVQLLYTHGVAAGRIDLHRFVDAASTRAARIFGLTGKGSIAIGGDADLCLWDPAHRGVISAATHQMASDYSAFEGWPVQGRAEVVTVRGTVMAEAGRFVGPFGHGRFLKRSPKLPG